MIFFFPDSKFSQAFLWKQKQSIGIVEFPDMLGIVGNVCVFFFTLYVHISAFSGKL